MEERGRHGIGLGGWVDICTEIDDEGEGIKGQPSLERRESNREGLRITA